MTNIMREYESNLVDDDSKKQVKESILSPIRSALYEGKKEPEAKILKSQYFREQPLKVTFERLIEYHDATPEIRMPVSAYRELITGTDMTFNSEIPEATEFIEEWVRKNNFYDKFENLVTTLLICGNALFEKLSESDITDVQEVDMSSIIAKKRDENGKLEWYEQRQLQGKIVKLGEKSIERYIEFNLTNYSQQAWGRSLFYPLAIPRTTGERIMAPLVEVLWAAQDAVGAILNNDAYPIKTITYPGANDSYLEKETEKWRRFKPGDTRIQKIKPEIEFFESQHSAGRYEAHWDALLKSIQIGVQFPTDIMTGDFTSRASSDTTENITMKLVRGYQLYLCNKLKAELFEPLLEQNGFKTQDVDLDVAFTAQNIIELEVPQIKDLVGSGLMTANEGREWLRENTGMKLPDDDKIEQKEEEDKQAFQMQGKVNDLESKIEQLSLDKNTDDKLQAMHEKLEKKLDMVKEAKESEDKLLFKRREKVLTKLIKEAETLG
jgi:hypothetical protein